jgi:hypothetical protein
VALGGLVGVNTPGSSITTSYATIGNVTSTAGVVQNGPNCAGSNACQYVSAGGLVGQNFGEIGTSYAQGNVSVGANGTGGGLAGFNSGLIENAAATGSVTGAPGASNANGEAAARRSAGSSATIRG